MNSAICATNELPLPSRFNGCDSGPRRRSSSTPAILLLLAFELFLPFRGSAAPARQVDFSREILPILSDNCFHCHGPDEKTRKAKLRLDTKEGAFRVSDGDAAIVPGNVADSQLIQRITSQDPDDVMPPPDSHRALTPLQIDLLKKWVAQGASWNQHWAFTSPVRASLPAIPPGFEKWPRTPLDRFILARLHKESFAPAPEAAPEIWLRRVTLDLTGLPPSPQEIQDFVKDPSPKAYEKAVDRLLESSRYGERMAADWLDLARYADTHGFQMDRYRAMWPWRDWVIKAFNQNLPYDQFVTWQLAGDLLPDATKEQRLATAFNRHHLQNEEGGIVEEEYRVAYVVDRVNTMGTAFLALTLECSRCHDHKFDPVSQRDFYSLFAFFQNIDESGQTTFFTEAMPVPALLLSDDLTDAKLLDYKTRITQAEKQLPALRSQAEGAFTEWLASKPAALAIPGLIGHFPFESAVSNKVANAANLARPGQTQENPNFAEGKSGLAIELNGENGVTFPGLGHFTRVDPFTLGFWIRPPSHAPRFVVAHHSRAPIDAGSRGYEVLLESGRVAFGLHHMWPGNSLKITTAAAIPAQQWTHVTITYDGSSRASGVKIYLDGAPASLETVRDGLTKDITYAGGEPDLAIGYRFRDNGFKGGRVDDFQIYQRALTPWEAAHLAGSAQLQTAWNTPPDQLTADQRAALLDFYVATAFPPALKFTEHLRALRQDQNRLIHPIPEIMVMKEMDRPRPAYTLKRGAYDAPGEPVSAGTPAALPPFPEGQPRNRLGFARWLLSPGHPLTARVTVNRLWQMMFGRGIVETADNFGTQGAYPTHPEMLDYLALQFVDSGWNLKQFLRQIALSAAYRQSSKPSPSQFARDPDNLLLSRGPSRRLTAEMLRDQALAASGLLVEKLGGPSVKPYQPEGLWEEKAMGAPRYEQGKGEDLHRRSLYTFWKRTVPHPAMITFDAADRNVCVVTRQSTSTPLQALALLNDVQILEAARHVSERMLKEGGSSLEHQVAWAFRLVASRAPSPQEIRILAQLFREQQQLFAQDQNAAAKLLAVGETVNDPSLNLVDLAAGTVLAQAILNHDEAVMRR